MPEIDHTPPAAATVSVTRLLVSLSLFTLCNLAGAAVIPLLAMATA